MKNLNEMDSKVENCGSIQELIEELEDKEPTNKKSKEYKEWQEKFNNLVEKYNILVNFVAYKKV
jgi:hypothetical protein